MTIGSETVLVEASDISRETRKGDHLIFTRLEVIKTGETYEVTALDYSRETFSSTFPSAALARIRSPYLPGLHFSFFWR